MTQSLWGTDQAPQNPFGSAAPVPPVPSPAAAPPQESIAPDDEPASRRTVYLAAGAAVGALVLAAGGFFLLRGGGGEDAALATPVLRTAPSAAASPTALPTGAPAVAAPGGRNPFASTIRETASASSTSSAQATAAPAPAPQVTVVKTVTSVRTLPPVVLAPTPVFLTLNAIVVGTGEANFVVDGKRFDALSPEARFGPDKRFTYMSQVDATDCVRVMYVDETLTLCKGDKIDVS